MSVNDAVADWAELELAPWRGVAIDRADLASGLRRLAIETPSLFLFDVDGSRIAIAEPEASVDPANIARFRHRAEIYRQFLEEALAASGVEGRGRFAIGLHDRSMARYALPLFGFQKLRGASTILLPDIDLLNLGFFDDEAYCDPIPFEAKRDAAIFAGSTTGGVITSSAVRQLQHPRLRSAIFFKDRPGVTFTLPDIVQCDTPETAALVAALGVGGRRLTWREQFDCKYLLSMDGNGATCSRVALALHSHGVLVKYNSPYLLHYFHGLEPWRDYLPVRRDADVLDIVARSSATAQRDRAIAERSQIFARAHLGRSAVMRYAACVMAGYLELFGEVGGPIAPAR